MTTAKRKPQHTTTGFTRRQQQQQLHFLRESNVGLEIESWSNVHFSPVLFVRWQLVPRFVMDIFDFAPGIPGLFVACLFSGALRYVFQWLWHSGRYIIRFDIHWSAVRYPHETPLTHRLFVFVNFLFHCLVLFRRCWTRWLQLSGKISSSCLSALEMLPTELLQSPLNCSVGETLKSLAANESLLAIG